MHQELILKANRETISDLELIEVSSEEVLDEVAEQNKNNDVMFEVEAEHIDSINEIESSHVSSKSIDSGLDKSAILLNYGEDKKP